MFNLSITIFKELILFIIWFVNFQEFFKLFLSFNPDNRISYSIYEVEEEASLKVALIVIKLTFSKRIKLSLLVDVNARNLAESILFFACELIFVVEV